MQELEKILEEIELEKKRVSLSPDCSNEHAVTETILLEKIEKIIRKHMDDAPENGGWIPVEERLPEDGKSVLCCSDDERMMIGVLHKEYYVDFGIAVAENYNQIMHDVIAWQPLPESYRPERSYEK